MGVHEEGFTNAMGDTTRLRGANTQEPEIGQTDKTKGTTLPGCFDQS
jgi:hypothetical protein